MLALPLFTPRVYASDEIKYFAALRSIYFDRDVHYANEYAYFIERDPVAHAGLRPFMEEATPTGYRLNDAPIGTAIMWAPFYATADVLVGAANLIGFSVSRDGYSWPYVWAVCLASLFWGTAGLLLSYRLCRIYVSRSSAIWGILAVWFASPVVFYLYITPAMAHANSLFSVALYLWVWHRTRGERTMTGWVVLGATAALMILVRELNWLFIAVVGIDEVLFLSSIRRSTAPNSAPFYELSRRFPGYLLFALTTVLLVLPQFYVYDTLHGSFGPTPFVVQKFSLIPREAKMDRTVQTHRPHHQVTFQEKNNVSSLELHSGNGYYSNRVSHGYKPV